MRNDTCAVGAANKTNIEAQSGQIGEIKVRLDRIEDALEKLTIGSAVRDWKIGLIIAVLVVAANLVVQLVLAANGG